jgi:hypothetical protein
MTEQTLSEKIFPEADGTELIIAKDVKDFIKIIQDECCRRALRNGTIVLTEVYNIIEENAGAKLCP